MLEALKQSNEDQNLVALAKKYCYGIKGDLAQRKRRVSGKAAGSPTNPTTATAAPTQATVSQGIGIPPPRQPTIDLTGRPTNGYVNRKHPPPGPVSSHTDDVEMYSALSNYLSHRKQ